MVTKRDAYTEHEIENEQRIELNRMHRCRHPCPDSLVSRNGIELCTNEEVKRSFILPAICSMFSVMFMAVEMFRRFFLFFFFLNLCVERESIEKYIHCNIEPTIIMDAGHAI